MPEIRYDPLQGRWVILAPERSSRPIEGAGDTGATDRTDCPFCPGNEGLTPPEIRAVRAPGSGPDRPGWRVRVVPNLYPALDSGSEPPAHASRLFRRRAGVGAHEVIIESPRHGDGMADLPLRHLTDVLRIYRDRIRALSCDPRLRFALIFKNYRIEAGASLLHPHSQLIATPVIPQNIGLRLDVARRHHRRTGRCLVCDLLDEEREEGTRVIGERAGFVALCPYASRFPYEILIAPTGHAANFFEIDEDGLHGLAVCLKDMLGRLRSAADNPPFNLFLNTAPFPRGRAGTRNRRSWGRQFHWTLEILPRKTAVAGFEWASGFHINSASPERCAEIMRRLRDS